ncbi:hypothetical protein Tco_1493318 [Tanacetum coccineum]
MDDDLFTYEVDVSNIPRDSNKDDDSEQRVSREADYDMGYDPSDVAFTEWINTNIFDFKTPMCKAFKEFNYLLQIDLDLLTKDIEGFKTCEEYKDDWIYEWNRDVPCVDEKPWTYTGVWTEPTPKNDGYCNEGNLPGAYIVGNLLHYQDYKWYEALKDSELKEQALKNKAIMEGLISDDESCNDSWRIWESHEITNVSLCSVPVQMKLRGMDTPYLLDGYDVLGKSSLFFFVDQSIVYGVSLMWIRHILQSQAMVF